MYKYTEITFTIFELIDTCWDVNMYEGLDEHSPSKN